MNSSRFSVAAFTSLSSSQLKKQVYLDPTLPGAIGISLHIKKIQAKSSIDLQKFLLNILWSESPSPSPSSPYKISWNDIKSHYNSIDPASQPSNINSDVKDAVSDLQQQLAVANIDPLDENEFEDFFYDDFNDNKDCNFDSHSARLHRDGWTRQPFLSKLKRVKNKAKLQTKGLLP
ncbi:hypothetical protein C1645_833289 [Glomus cerebriforme]|uniref:Uncharacterized protein n=1 Tax=Glomus cerebriforme TaxID=658196 RepID=A0A397SE23_9GLOM|nr:hypothetical protein C1645_833289 [Glomus cerebriforme]